MKPFVSTASRTRAATAALRMVGISGVIMSSLYLAYRLLEQPSHNQVVLSPVQKVPTARKMESEWIATVASRPLREKAPAVVATPPPAVPKPPPAPQLELVGTMVNSGQTARAFIRSKAAGKLITVQPGKEIDGAVVKTIVDGEVTLEFGGHEFVIRTSRKAS
jgi:hypothetical protein